MAIRNYKTSAEIRRVVKNLKLSFRSDKLRLTSLRRSVNVASLNNETVAARRPVKKTIKKPVAKPGARKPAPKAKTNNDIFITRGPGSTKPAGRAAAPTKPTAKKSVNNKTIQNLTDLLANRQERLQIAEHIRQLLIHHFDQEDKTVSRLTKAVELLVKESRQLFADTENTLSDISQNVISPDFTELVEYVYEQLAERFDGRFDDMQVKYSVAVKPESLTKTKGITKTTVDNTISYNIGYIIFDNLQSSTSTQDYVVTITRVRNGNREQDYVRTLTDYRPPSWFVKHSPGIAFSDADRALKIIYNTMAMEDMLDVAEPTALPIKKHHVMYLNEMVQETDVDEKNGYIKIYLKPGIKDADVKKTLIDLFGDTKNLVKAIHPRYKNPVRALTPKKVKRTIKLKNGSTKSVEQWMLVFAFAKLQGEDEPVQVPRDKIKTFMETFEIDDEETVRDFNRLLKNFLGVK